MARLGNVNQDDRIDEEDLSLLSSRGSVRRLPTQADVDCNQTIDERDEEALRAHILEGAEMLPCETPTDVAIGLRHICVLSEGRVRCFGDNTLGQLGTSDRPSGASAAHSVALTLPGRVVSMAAGSLHTCALLERGSVACWGDNQLGQLGGNPSHRGAPVLVPLNEQAVDVQAGAGHSCALMEDGAVRCWGDDQFGQLGRGPHQLEEEPFSEAVLPGPATAIALGASHSCALMSDASVRCWGLNQFGQLGLGHAENLGDDELPTASPPVVVGGSVSRITAGWMQTCAQREDGAFLCWGDNTFSQLGFSGPARVGDDELPTAVAPLDLGGDVVELALGQAHTCARYEDSSIRCWGLGVSGALGYGNALSPPPGGPPPPPPSGGPPIPFTPPAQLPPVPLGDSVDALYAGAQSTCGRAVSGELYCFGANSWGQLGYDFRYNVGDDETPEEVGPLPLTEEPQLGWRFVEAPTLDARLWVRSTPYGSRIRLSLRDPSLDDEELIALYPLSAQEDPTLSVQLDEHPRSEGHVSLIEEGNSRYALSFVFDADGGAGRCDGSATERARIGFGREHPVWDTSNDYGASGLVLRRWTDRPRVQILRADGTVHQGWWRESSAE